MKTPDSKEGKKQWEEFYGKKYPHIGWWGKPESLDDAVFDIQPIESTVSDYKKETENPNTFVIMLTGRLPHQSSQVEELLALHNIYFKEYHYKSNGDTLTSKLNTIKSLLNRFPQVKEVEMWEDREAHVIAFEEWGKENGINIKVNYITDGVVPLNESVEDKLYNKVSTMIKPPYADFLLKMGFGKDSMEQIFKKIFGDDITLRFIDKNNHSEEGTDYYLYVRDSKRDLKYFESGFIEKGKEINWQLFDNSENKKYKDSDGRKRIVVDIGGGTELIYDTDLDNWEEAPISIKKDKFFTESEDKFHKYHTKLSNFVKPPYFKNLNYLGVDFKDWKPVLSMIFDRDIKLDGVTQDRNDIIDSLTGEIIYSESDFGPDKGQTFANYITGEYGDTLD